MGYKQFKERNITWDENCALYYHRPDIYEKDMQKNWEVVRGVKRTFYSNYQRNSREIQVGDIIEYVDGNHYYPRAYVDEIDKFGVIHICNSGHSFTRGNFFSTSGGPWKHVHKSHFEFAGYEYRSCWTWGYRGSGANQGIDFKLLVKKFRQIDMPKIKPFHEIHINSPWWRERRNDKRVIVMSDSSYIFEEFDKISDFKVWADYIGLTYHKRDDGRYFADQFLKSEYFWKLEELPEGCKPIEVTCNGSDVCGFVRKVDDVITFFRPNPNAKEVYVPMTEKVY